MTPALGRTLAAAGLAVMLATCSRPHHDSAAEAGATTVRPPAPPPLEIPKPAPPLDRAALLAAVAQAAEAFATGHPYPSDVVQLAGRRLEVRLPFGCHGPPPATAALRYEWDPDAHKIKFSVTPQTWTQAPEVRDLVGTAKTEALEGFWISRPWISAADCPRQDAPSSEPASPETVGLIQVFERGGSRLLRRNGKPYEITRKLGDGEAPPDNGYRVIVSGRIPEGGTPVFCRSDGPDQRPTCFVRMELDRVALETDAGTAIAEWTS